MYNLTARRRKKFHLDFICEEVKNISLFFSCCILGFVLKDGTRCFVHYYGVIGDCPALKKILEFISHVGYYPCFFCYVKGVHVGGRGGKRQYYYHDGWKSCDSITYERQSIQALNQSINVFGHLGHSITGINHRRLSSCDTFASY